MPKIDIWPPPNLVQFDATRYDTFERVEPEGINATDITALLHQVNTHVDQHCGAGTMKRVTIFVVLDEPEEG